MVSFFKEFYSDFGMCRPKLNVHFKHLDNPQRYWLERPITEEEVKSVVWGFDGEKALSPDKFSMAFFKACWMSLKGT